MSLNISYKSNNELIRERMIQENQDIENRFEISMDNLTERVKKSGIKCKTNIPKKDQFSVFIYKNIISIDYIGAINFKIKTFDTFNEAIIYLIDIVKFRIIKNGKYISLSKDSGEDDIDVYSYLGIIYNNQYNHKYLTGEIISIIEDDIYTWRIRYCDIKYVNLKRSKPKLDVYCCYTTKKSKVRYDEHKRKISKLKRKYRKFKFEQYNGGNNDILNVFFSKSLHIKYLNSDSNYKLHKQYLRHCDLIVNGLNSNSEDYLTSDDYSSTSDIESSS